MDANQHGTEYAQNQYRIWQDKCRICKINDNLIPLPYTEASRMSDYELGATLAAIMANRLIRNLIAAK